MAGYKIHLKPSAIDDLDRLSKSRAVEVADAIGRFLAYEPARTTSSRIKRLRGLSDPDYRLRVGEMRVFYSIDEDGRVVEVLRVMHKDETAAYYRKVKDESRTDG